MIWHENDGRPKIGAIHNVLIPLAPSPSIMAPCMRLPLQAVEGTAEVVDDSVFEMPLIREAKSERGGRGDKKHLSGEHHTPARERFVLQSTYSQVAAAEGAPPSLCAHHEDRSMGVGTGGRC